MAVAIPKGTTLQQTVFNINNCADFEEACLQVFAFQYKYNPVYHAFCGAVKKSPANVSAITGIPFLPVSFFKTHRVCTTAFEPQVVFESSSTTGQTVSRHLVKETSLYEQSFKKAFTLFYGDVQQYCVLALLPSYLERHHSSLVYMADQLIKDSGHPRSSFYLHDFKGLSETMQQLEAEGQKTLLIGVTYALLDFAEAFPTPLFNTVIIETGGMKGRKKELVRNEVHELLKKAFHLSGIHSEYGMTELLSQAYAYEGGRFKTPPWMKMLIREEDDPFALHSITDTAITGGISIIDLANLYSCSFLAIEDVGRSYKDGTFEVLGRLDNSDVRGCSLLAL